ncbi:YraN family protein [Paenibacillus sp. LC231]|uniref:YraN family protein n=1 Tax=unclassified Paenibacillus TaxID=185978 RepID=UPI0008DE78AD|nr:MULTISPECIES: YraN family protein [unclassified Paenibacillus]MCT1398586.1 YraN family protein [Paenibacillus sp. p3-SID867]OIB02612.1 YraN family protein [Paenibacillus sp. LC231]
MNSPSGKKDSRKQKGAAAEELAAAALIEKGYRVLDRNWRCRFGELDIVAETGGTLVVIEVRSRSGTTSFGTPSESVNARKVMQVRNTAQQYVHHKRYYERPIRFDVISIILRPDLTPVSMEHIENAF